MKFVVMCASGTETKYWILKCFDTLIEARKYVAKQNAIQREYHQTGHWRFKIEELTENELFDRY